MEDYEMVEKEATEILEDMGGNAEDICSGDCTTFAMRLVDNLKNLNIEAVIVNNLNNEMTDELNGYKTINAEYENGISHCYVKACGYFFDAFDTDGCEKEQELGYHAIY